jgi:hypothetical protein
MFNFSTLTGVISKYNVRYVEFKGIWRWYMAVLSHSCRMFDTREVNHVWSYMQIQSTDTKDNIVEQAA